VHDAPCGPPVYPGLRRQTDQPGGCLPGRPAVQRSSALLVNCAPAGNTTSAGGHPTRWICKSPLSSHAPILGDQSPRASSHAASRLPPPGCVLLSRRPVLFASSLEWLTVCLPRRGHTRGISLRTKPLSQRYPTLRGVLRHVVGEPRLEETLYGGTEGKCEGGHLIRCLSLRTNRRCRYWTSLDTERRPPHSQGPAAHRGAADAAMMLGAGCPTSCLIITSIRPSGLFAPIPSQVGEQSRRKQKGRRHRETSPVSNRGLAVAPLSCASVLACGAPVDKQNKLLQRHGDDPDRDPRSMYVRLAPSGRIGENVRP
jgi:hypothetical protein